MRLLFLCDWCIKVYNWVKLFQEKKIRSVWNEEEQQWCFSVVDVVGVLTDSVNPTDYPELAQERMKELYE